MYTYTPTGRCVLYVLAGIVLCVLAQCTCTIIDGDIIRCTIPNLERIRYVLEIATVQQHETDPTNTFTAVLTDISNN